MLLIQSYHILTLNDINQHGLINMFSITQYIERLNNNLRYLVSGELSLEITHKRHLLL